jgi:hypothetical protein
VADDKPKTVPLDAKLISLTEDYEIAYWRKRLGVSDDRLAEAVRRVGPRGRGRRGTSGEAHLKTSARPRFTGKVLSKPAAFEKLAAEIQAPFRSRP